ncbi:MAG: 16S rRNA (uracil(1498)-N(3))-methyltransferase [Clostridia bacterium]|nr:16S rRNA (uracil(1498)-N(3))-methyltransferase [Clostridia bacterium]
MNSFYIEGVGATGAVATLKAEDAKHAAQVMRMQPGEAFYAVDESGKRFCAEMREVSKTECTALLREELPDNEADVRITVYQGLPKAEKMELVTQKLTELGAYRLVPVKMERCIVKLDEKDGKKRCERLNKIAREAAKQCKRGSCLEVTEPKTWKQLQATLRDDHDLILVPWEDAHGYGLNAARAEFPDAKNIGIVIGPEGGMSENEVKALEELGARQITLGPRILRTETAAIAACTMAMLLWGDIG